MGSVLLSFLVVVVLLLLLKTVGTKPVALTHVTNQSVQHAVRV